MAALARVAPALITTVVAATIAAPATAVPATATCGPARQLAAADAYITALGDRTKAGAVPFAPNAVRFENGLQTGFSGEQLRGDLDRHLQYSIMDAPKVTARTVAPGGDADLLNYRFIVPVRIAGQRIVDAPTDEDFRIPRSTCLITRIDARITITPPR
ncbi:hypothetical protein [Tsukamurella spumae]|uniref:DUF8021 domain-containing protein n=1 Tax=Tsukamurella spumae TaxID=44753 RepID=A0A846X6Z9_9ACTN|nr:hypothetical protein [Tsukamurella spumae]NKY20079.1 hypothetical protein [Tsukamurella spumae]